MDKQRAGLAAQMFFDRWLAVWSPLDEAMNGLITTLRISGEILPRRRGSSAGLLAGIVTAPLRLADFVYNRFLAQAADGFIWTRLQDRLYGSDRTGFTPQGAAASPLAHVGQWPSLPPPLQSALKKHADSQAAATLTRLREGFAELAHNPEQTDDLLGTLHRELTWQEVVHSSYFDMAGVRRVIATHLVQKSDHPADALATKGRLAPAVADWLAEGPAPAPSEGKAGEQNRFSPPANRPDRMALSALANLAATLAVILLWISAGVLHTNFVRPFTDAFQAEQVLADLSARQFPVREFEMQVTDYGPWLRVLVRTKRVERALADAKIIQTDETNGAFEYPYIHILSAALLDGNQTTARTVLRQVGFSRYSNLDEFNQLVQGPKHAEALDGLLKVLKSFDSEDRKDDIEGLGEEIGIAQRELKSANANRDSGGGGLEDRSNKLSPSELSGEIDKLKELGGFVFEWELGKFIETVAVQGAVPLAPDQFSAIAWEKANTDTLAKSARQLFQAGDRESARKIAAVLEGKLGGLTHQSDTISALVSLAILNHVLGQKSASAAALDRLKQLLPARPDNSSEGATRSQYSDDDVYFAIIWGAVHGAVSVVEEIKPRMKFLRLTNYNTLVRIDGSLYIPTSEPDLAMVLGYAKAGQPEPALKWLDTVGSLYDDDRKVVLKAFAASGIEEHLIGRAGLSTGKPDSSYQIVAEARHLAGRSVDAAETGSKIQDAVTRYHTLLPILLSIARSDEASVGRFLTFLDHQAVLQAPAPLMTYLIEQDQALLALRFATDLISLREDTKGRMNDENFIVQVNILQGIVTDYFAKTENFSRRLGLIDAAAISADLPQQRLRSLWRTFVSIQYARLGRLRAARLHCASCNILDQATAYSAVLNAEFNKRHSIEWTRADYAREYRYFFISLQKR